MYQYVFVSVFYYNIDRNNFKLSVHRNPKLIKSHRVIAPLSQPIKFSSKTNWILVTLPWYLFCLWQCNEIVGRIQHHGRESKGQKMIRDFPWAQCIIIIIKKKKTKQNKTKRVHEYSEKKSSWFSRLFWFFRVQTKRFCLDTGPHSFLIIQCQHHGPFSQ